jgi:hypothetical protein
MRIVFIAAGAIVLGGAALIGTGSAHATVTPAPSHRSAAAFAPVVVEWFSKAAPRPGESVTLFVRYLNNNKPIQGAQLKATVKRDSTVLLKLEGNTTSAKGLARAKFRVPAHTAGQTLLVPVTMTYQGQITHAKGALRVGK